LTRASGTVRLPGSKSISNRMLLLAALALGSTEIRDLLDSDDTRVMLDALRKIGVGVTALGGNAWRVEGCGGAFPIKDGRPVHGQRRHRDPAADRRLGAVGRQLSPVRRAAHARAADRRPGRRTAADRCRRALCRQHRLSAAEHPSRRR
jgi:hypothetical protein